MEFRKKRKRSASIDESSSAYVFIPEEVVIEILLRLPVKPLFRFNCVSKQWKSIICSPEFMRTYNRRASNHSEYYEMPFPYLNLVHIPEKLPEKLTASSSIELHPRQKQRLTMSVFSRYAKKRVSGLELVASSNGLILYAAYNTRKLRNGLDRSSMDFCVLNPLTNQSVMLPMVRGPFTGKPAVGFATRAAAAAEDSDDGACFTYKVVLVQRVLGSKADATVMTFSSDRGRWRTIKKAISCPESVLRYRLGKREYNKAYTSRKGILHWFDVLEKIIVTYDPYNSPDRFGRIKLPTTNGSGLHCYMNVVELGDEDVLKFGVVETVAGNLNGRLLVWRLSDWDEWVRENRHPIILPLGYILHSLKYVLEHDMHHVVALGGAKLFYEVYCTRRRRVVLVNLLKGNPKPIMNLEKKLGRISCKYASVAPAALCPWSSPFYTQRQNKTTTSSSFRNK